VGLAPSTGMITFPRGWTGTCHGDEIVLSPDGGRSAEIRYVERRRPLLAAADLLHAHATFPDFRLTAIDPPLLEQTAEGEHAILVTYRGLLRHVPVLRPCAFVLGDDFYALLLGLVRDGGGASEIVDLVGSLALADRHMLGVRRRRFLYEPPAD